MLTPGIYRQTGEACRAYCLENLRQFDAVVFAWFLPAHHKTRAVQPKLYS